jgi:hypothetical protein
MHMLREVLRDFLHFLMVVNGACAVISWAMAIHLGFVSAGELPKRRGLLTMRYWLPSELPDEYHARRRRLMRLMFVFAALLTIEAVLILLDILFFKAPN